MIQPFSGLAEYLILSLLAVGENVLAFARPMRRLPTDSSLMGQGRDLLRVSTLSDAYVLCVLVRR